MRITVGTEHAGLDYAVRLDKWLQDKGHQVSLVQEDENTKGYAAIAEKAVLEMTEGDSELTILICGTGIAMCESADKIPGTRAALCVTSYMGKMAKQHNNANVLVFGCRVIGFESMLDILDTFFATEFEGGRHLPRLAALKALEEKYKKG